MIVERFSITSPFASSEGAVAFLQVTPPVPTAHADVDAYALNDADSTIIDETEESSNLRISSSLVTS
jgi:hypothetical protein